MQNLYRILNSEINENLFNYEILFSDKNHPIFKAHFPENSLLPAFLQIDIASNLLEKKVILIKKAKFINPILPNDKIKFEIYNKNNSFLVITKKDDQKCSEFTFVTK